MSKFWFMVVTVVILIFALETFLLLFPSKWIYSIRWLPNHCTGDVRNGHVPKICWSLVAGFDARNPRTEIMHHESMLRRSGFSHQYPQRVRALEPLHTAAATARHFKVHWPTLTGGRGPASRALTTLRAPRIFLIIIIHGIVAQRSTGRGGGMSRIAWTSPAKATTATLRAGATTNPLLTTHLLPVLHGI